MSIVLEDVRKSVYVFFVAFLLSNSHIFAQIGHWTDNALGFNSLLKAVGQLLFGLLFLFFFYNLVSYLRKGENTKTQEKLKGMLWSIVIIFIMISIWGGIVFLQSIFGIVA